MNKRVLFICVHNSARSQMAAAFTNHYGKGRMTADSAGLEPGTLNPYVVKVMAERGIDISRNTPKSVMDVYQAGKPFDIIVTVCDPEAGQRCPVFPGEAERLHWAFADPSVLHGDESFILAETRKIRDAIEEKVRQWIKEIKWEKSKNLDC
ncbi:MAG TPA: arsenate reductase ArsC [Candidatus Mcinerneyibacteriales bacterium]|nr:arsenate reductase ArsC [Candidatus Mcinerneyibacteriales bacterium]